MNERKPVGQENAMEAAAEEPSVIVVSAYRRRGICRQE